MTSFAASVTSGPDLFFELANPITAEYSSVVFSILFANRLNDQDAKIFSNPQNNPVLNDAVAFMSKTCWSQQVAQCDQPLTPLNQLSDAAGVADSDCVAFFLNNDYKAFITIPLRGPSGEMFIPAVASKEEKTENDIRLMHSRLYDALCAYEKSGVAQGKPISLVLTQREKQCLELAAAGRTEKRTAAELGISPHTVHTHLESSKRKLGAPTKIAAVLKGLARGELSQSEIENRF